MLRRVLILLLCLVMVPVPIQANEGPPWTPAQWLDNPDWEWETDWTEEEKASYVIGALEGEIWDWPGEAEELSWWVIYYQGKLTEAGDGDGSPEHVAMIAVAWYHLDLVAAEMEAGDEDQASAASDLASAKNWYDQESWGLAIIRAQWGFEHLDDLTEHWDEVNRLLALVGDAVYDLEMDLTPDDPDEPME